MLVLDWSIVISKKIQPGSNVLRFTCHVRPLDIYKMDHEDKNIMSDTKFSVCSRDNVVSSNLSFTDSFLQVLDVMTVNGNSC